MSAMEKVENGDFVRMDYTGSANGMIFDTSIAEVAKKAGLYDENKDYRPLLVCVGSGDVIKGLDDALPGMGNEGKKKQITVPPEKGYGQRNPRLIKIVPMNIFKKSKIAPLPGMVINLDGLPAKVQSVSGGRVRIDFNHELAGRVLEFEINVLEIIRKTEEKLRALAEEAFGNDGKEIKFELDGKKKSLLVTMPWKAKEQREDYETRKKIIKALVLAKMKSEIGDVKFAEEEGEVASEKKK